MPKISDRAAQVDPNFPLPPGVQGLTTLTPEENENDQGLAELGYDEIDAETINAGIPIPDNITIVSQEVKFASNGTYLVDIIIDIELEGYEEFEVRVAKP